MSSLLPVSKDNESAITVEPSATKMNILLRVSGSPLPQYFNVIRRGFLTKKIQA